jgi:AcrR family transcriptional regulator
MARHKDQAARRGQLQRATRKLIASRGIDRLRIKDIAAETGLSSQSVLYYYPDIDELVEAAIEHTLERFGQRRSDVAVGIEDPCEALLSIIRSGLPTGPDDEDLRILYEASGYFRDNERLGDAIRSMTARQVDVYRHVLELGAARGVFDLADSSASIARNLVALEDAYGLYVIGGAPMVDEALELILSFAAIATRCPRLRELGVAQPRVVRDLDRR